MISNGSRKARTKNIFPFWITRNRNVQKKWLLWKIRLTLYRNKRPSLQLHFPKSRNSSTISRRFSRIPRSLFRKYDDPERLLPEAGMLESGKAFREKKALPILGKLLKYARSLFRENTELKAKVQKLEKENTAFKSANWNHTHEMVRLQMENRELKKDKSTLDALVGRIGNDVLQKLLNETPKEQPKHKEKSL